MALTDEDLREAASHRGLKLVKSRKRKPGVGDYGLFGLTDGSGKPLFGVDGNALTATAEQIADFLRKGEVSTWAASAESTPAHSGPASSAEPRPPEAEDDAPSAIRPRRRKSAQAPTERPPQRREHPATTDVAGDPRAGRSRPKVRLVPEPAPRLEPELAIRAARPADADAVHKMLVAIGFKLDALDIRRAIAAATTRKEPVLVVDRDGVIGCLAWHIVPTIQRGAIARITMILVDEDERRGGVGRALYEAALSQFRKLKLRSVEAMSDIEVRNANGFYRALGLKQTSYRFAADI